MPLCPVRGRQRLNLYFPGISIKIKDLKFKKSFLITDKKR